MAFSARFTYPFYTGTRSVAASVVPGKYPTALAGHPYLLDLAPPAYTSSGRLHHASIPLLRPQSDTSGIPGESSLNPEGTWRRAQDSWHHGAGQTYVDKPESDVARFRSSKGCLVWNKWELGLLQDTERKKASANTNLGLVAAGARLYVIDGTGIAFTTSVSAAGLATWTAVTGGPSTAPVSIASDGYNILTAHGSDGIYYTTRASTTTTSYVTGTVNLVAYVKDRIMAAGGNTIYNITTAYPGPASLPTALFTHRNPDFNWVGFAEGNKAIYAAGYSGDKSVIYQTAVQPEGTALTVPTVAGELPDGEIIRSIQGYLGFIVIGTDLGVRFASADNNGNLTIGSLIRTNSSVRAFEPQDRFVWFGWSNYDGVSTGLGRLDLQTFTALSTPAYASDLMVTGQGTVTSIVTFQDRRVFSVGALGVYAEDTAHKVATGQLDTGLFTFGTPDTKTALFLDVRYKVIAGSHTAYIAKEDGVFTVIGSHAASFDVGQFTIPEIRGDAFELREVLARDTINTNTGPVISRHTLKASVSADPGEFIYAPFLLTEEEDLGHQREHRDVIAELDFIKSLRADQARVVYQEGRKSYSVTVDDYDWIPTHMTHNNDGFNGTCVVKLRKVTGL